MAQPNPLMILPFGLLLALIAVAPLSFSSWWSRHYPKVCLALGLVVTAYYVTGLRAELRLFETAEDYLRFIALVASLFIVSGGIHITVKGEATPLANVMFLLLGGLASNLVGTTGASMLLIRPWLRMNRYRVTGYHVVFFIFIISNVGGCLTPIGDPPLYLGYLKGIPFWWVTQHCWPVWCSGMGILLAVFYILDYRNGTVRLDQIGVCLLLGNRAYHKLIVAISAGAVFFGANTYIGNGPNFMVKAIADQQKVHTPSFLGYVTGFTIPYMVPMLFVVWWLFFRV